MLNCMCVQIPKNIVEERLRWIKPIADGEIRLVDAVKVCSHGKRTLERWLSNYKRFGEAGLLPKSTRPRTSPNETPIHIKNRVFELRTETKECAIKLKWKLETENIFLDERTIGKFIKTEGLVRKYRQRKKYPPKPKIQLRPGELVEIDIKYVPGRIGGKRYYQFTAIDCASRWRYLEIFDDYGNYASIKFLEKLIRIARFEIKAIKTDNGSNFTNRYTGYKKSSDSSNPRLHPLDIECKKLNIEHYLIDPGKPAQNGRVERSHRSDQETFYENTEYKTPEELKYKLKLWNMYYNDFPHCSLQGKTPNQMLQLARTII